MQVEGQRGGCLHSLPATGARVSNAYRTCLILGNSLAKVRLMPGVPRGPHGHPPPMNVSPPGHAPLWAYGVLVGISTGYPPVAGRFHTCYSPVRRSPAGKASFAPAAPRLACVRPVASVHPEPGSNSPLLLSFSCFFLSIIRPRKSSPPKLRYPSAAQRRPNLSLLYLCKESL